MPSKQHDNLFSLVKSLTKAEKRHFTLYISRQQSNEKAKFKRLFAIMDKMKVYDEKQVLKKESTIKEAQLSNLKAHLYNELLISLRLFYSSKNLDMEIRELLDFARILYNRGLVLQSLKILDKAKSIAKANSHYILTLEVLQFEQNIEARHITRSIEGRALELHQETNEMLDQVNETARISSLALRLYSMYLERGHVTNEKESKKLEQFFLKELKQINISLSGFFGRIFLHQAYCWYYFMQIDFPHYYQHAQKWVNLFEQHPNTIKDDPFLYLKGIHNLVLALFNIGKHDQLKQGTDKLQRLYEEAGSFSENLKIQAFVYTYTAKLNYLFLTGNFTEGLAIVPEIENNLFNYSRYIDTHRVMIFYYKIACLYFGAGESESCILYLNKIINQKLGQLRSDIQCFARLLHLIAHYELGNTDILGYLIKSVYRFLSKMENLDDLLIEILEFLKKSLSTKKQNVTKDFIALKNKLNQIAKNKYARRSYQYLDIVSWLESKIEDIPVEEIIRRKTKSRL